MGHPARPTIIAENQTASPVVLTDLGISVPASGSFTLSDFFYTHEVQDSSSLYAAITAGDILINDGSTTLTQSQSQQFVTPPTSAQNLQNAATGPGSSTTNAIPRFSGTTGKVLVNSGITIDGSNVMTLPSTRITGVATPVNPSDVATKAYADMLSGGVDWQESVISRSASPPGSPTTGDRYLIIATATGAWTGNEDQIAQWNGSTWDFTLPSAGMATYVEAEFTTYIYNGTAWVQQASSFSHSALQNLSANDHPQYLLRNGTNAMTAALDMGGFSITNVNLVDGVDVSAHASRHNPGGADALATAAPTQGIGGANAEGSAASYARSDHNHTLRETGGPTDLTIAAIADGEAIRRTGTTIAGGIGKRYPAAATDPVSPAPANGDRYFNTVLGMEMSYDSTRSKWLSSEASEIEFGRAGGTAAGSYYRGIDSIVMSDVTGRHAEFNGTVVSLAYTRTDNDAATFEVTANGTNVATLASAAFTGRDTALNGNFSAGDILGVRNASGGNGTSNVAGKVRVRWRI